MRTRYATDGRQLVQVSRQGHRVVAPLRTSPRALAIGVRGRWVLLTERWHVMGDVDTQLRILDAFSLDERVQAQVDDEDRYGLDPEGHFVIGTRMIDRTRWRAWNASDMRKIDDYDLPPGAELAPFATLTTFAKLPRLEAASPLGTWTIVLEPTSRDHPGVVIASADGVRIEQDLGDRTITRTVNEEFTLNGNEASWYGDYGTNDVSVRIVALNNEHAELTWQDGVTYDWEITLTR